MQLLASTGCWTLWSLALHVAVTLPICPSLGTIPGCKCYLARVYVLGVCNHQKCTALVWSSLFRHSAMSREDVRRFCCSVMPPCAAACSHYRGRGAFESMGAGIAMAPGDIAFKCNFATVNNQVQPGPDL
jgi:hypothetical protein